MEKSEVGYILFCFTIYYHFILNYIWSGKWRAYLFLKYIEKQIY